MERSMRLAAALIACLPATCLVSRPLAVPISGCARSSSSSTSRRGRVLELRAADWSSDEVIAARESLINSKDFEALVKRMEDKSRHDVEVMEDMEDITIGAEDKERQEDYFWVRPNSWKQNTEKLDSLRTTVLKSERARAIAGKLRRAGTGSRLRATPIRVEETAQLQQNESRVSSDPVVVDDVEGQFPRLEQAEEKGATRNGTGPLGIRWIRSVASKVSRMGKLARGRVARAVGDGRYHLPQ